MNVLIACEFSGIIREAFRSRGHDAWSCDLLDTEIPGNHFKTDILNVIDLGWDLMIAHPPCTDLAISGARYWTEKWADGRLRASINFFIRLANADIPKVCVENPISIMSTQWRKPDQIIQPYMFGHPESKKTCLWLKCLPLLQPTNMLPKPVPNGGCIRQTGSRKGRIYNYYYHQGKSAKERGRTFQGIAEAMAEQWGR